jgi:hypothetical protein
MSEVEESTRSGLLVSAEADGDRPLLPRGHAPKRAKTGGRARGTPNRVTTNVRAALKDLADNNADRIQAWLDRVATENPAEALRLYLALIRYVVPVLSATAIADITPKSSREQLSKLSDDELMAIIVESSEAVELVRQGVKTRDELIQRIAAPTPTLPKPGRLISADYDEELLR